MKKNLKNYWVAGSLSLMIASMGVLIWLSSHGTQDSNKQLATTKTSADIAKPAPPPLAPIYTEGPLSKLPTDEQKLAQFIQSRFGKHIDHPYWRIQAIEQLTDFLKKKYPNDWQDRLKNMLKLIFPADYEQLLKALAAYTSYNEWLTSIQEGALVFNSKEERLRATWDKRQQLFGEDAKVIWQSQVKQEQIDAALQKIETSSLPLSAKVDSYVKTLINVHGADATNPDKSHPVQTMGQFLELKSVQDQLHTLAPEQQKKELTHLREALGMDKEAIKRWDELDSERENRASAGTTYMKERAALEKQYQGDALKVQIQGLQNRLFGAEEAVFIRNEEESGTFRYQERQIIGVN